MSRLLVFTDLDGTLLAHADYRWDAARPALTALAGRGVPLVFTSSKTRAEIELWRARLGNHDPFISENGGALYLPRDFLPRPLPGAEATGDYERVAFGTPYAEVRRALEEIARETGLPLRGFGDMDVTEIAERTGLPPEVAALSAAREYDEPFVGEGPLGEEEEGRLAAAAAARGLRLTRGGRFHHLLGEHDKGRAARLLAEAYGAGGEGVAIMALGDGANDLDLLRAAEFPVVVARPDGTHTPELRAAVPRARFTRGAGPVGFNEAVLERLGALA